MPRSDENFLISELKNVIEKFQKQKNVASFIHRGNELYNYLYLLKNNMGDAIPSLKATLKELFQLPTYSGKQIIGDSAAFSEEAHNFLLNQLAALKESNSIIFYGFTGEGANGVVAELIEKEILSPKKIMVNIVANASLTAIEKHQSQYSKKIQNFLIVDDGQGGCEFGDDIDLSDPLAAELFCLEGGVISFGQVLNTLIQHEKPHITVYTGLREKDNTGFQRTLFSASELFLTLQKAIQNNELENSDQFENILTDYLMYHRLNPDNNNDNESKQKQIQDYFDKFKQLKEITQQQIIEKIKSIQSINYLLDFLPTQKKKHIPQTDFFLKDTEKVNSHLDVIFYKSLSN